MKQAKTTMMLMARWLVVLAASLVVSSGNAFASAPTKAKSSCDASCTKRCPCCISKSAPVNSSAPLAPVSSTRTSVAKDLQLTPLLAAWFAAAPTTASLVPSQLAAPHFSVSLPVFVRHCTFLI